MPKENINLPWENPLLENVTRFGLHNDFCNHYIVYFVKKEENIFIYYLSIQAWVSCSNSRSKHVLHASRTC